MGQPTNKGADEMVQKIANMLWEGDGRSAADGKSKYAPDTLEKAISYLEQSFPVNYDTRYAAALLNTNGVLFSMVAKNHMDLECLPSGKFATNALVLELGLIVYNIFKMIGQGTIGGRAPRQKRNVKRGRLHTVISNLIMMASYVTTHVRQLIMVLGKSNVWRHLFADFREKMLLCTKIRCRFIHELYFESPFFRKTLVVSVEIALDLKSCRAYISEATLSTEKLQKNTTINNIMYKITSFFMSWL